MPTARRVFQKFSKLPLGFFWTAVTALIYTPMFLLYSDTEGGGSFTLASFAILLALCLGAILLSYIVQWVSPKFGMIFDRMMSGVALYLLITVIFFPVQRGVLDGKIASISLLDMASHLVLFGVCLTLTLVSLRKPKIEFLQRKIVTILGGFALLASIYMGVASALPLYTDNSALAKQW